MPENTPPGAAFEHGQFEIKKLYVKDVSFESPNSPRIFLTEWKPDLDFHLHSEAMRFSSTSYEVSLVGTVKVESEDAVMYLVEANVAGIFDVVGFTQDELGALLGVYCPSVLFPYLREVVSDLVVRGGFPQLVLAPVNFEVLYERQLAEAGAPPVAEPVPDEGGAG